MLIFTHSAGSIKAHEQGLSVFSKPYTEEKCCVENERISISRHILRCQCGDVVVETALNFPILF